MEIGKKIEEYFKKTDGEGMIELHVTPREIWGEMLHTSVCSSEYADLKRLYRDGCKFIYYHGAKLISKEPNCSESV